MKLLSSTLLLFSSLSISTLALPQPNPLLDTTSVGQLALNGAAGAISKIGQDGGVHAMTRWDWNDCGSEGDAITIKSLRVSPDPPKPGHNLTIFATGTVNELIDFGAYADVTVKLGLIKLLTKRFDVCDELDGAKSQLQCPIIADEYSIEQTVELPAEIPRAKFNVAVRAFTVEDNPMACIDLSINFLIPDA